MRLNLNNNNRCPFRQIYRRAIVAALFGAAVCLIRPSVAHAGARRFTYVYETTTASPGEIEIENWVTWKTRTAENSRFNQFDFRHEFEFGITDRLQAAVYVADWFYKDDGDKSESRYKDSAVELIYNLTSPTSDLLGSAAYFEFKIGDELIEIEGGILLQKNIGRFVFGYNAVLEGEWEGSHYDERAGEFKQSAGVSFEITPSFLVGAELLHEIELPDWSEARPSVVYLGPNASYRRGNWWATVTPLVQLTDIADEPDVQTRLIFGFEF